jgi:hypothetical protein
VPVAAAALLTSLGGCGAVWTYNQAMDLRRATYGFQFDPPDSVAYALPTPPPVYAAIFDERTYVPPAPVVLPPTRTWRPRGGTADTLATTPPLITLEPPPPVQIDLTPAQESELRGRAQRDMAAAENLIARHARTAPPGAGESEQIRVARGLLVQTRAALDRRDYQGAANLAEKARVLAERLIERQP